VVKQAAQDGLKVEAQDVAERAVRGAGYSGTPLAKKLGIRGGDRVATLGAPAGFEGLLAPLPPGVRLVADPDPDPDPAPGSGAGGGYEVVIAFVPDAAHLEPRFQRGQALMSPHGGLWIAWPKQSSPLATAFREGDVRAHGLAARLVDNKICAIDADWSGLRFVVRREDRPPQRS
jgi:hypothetical protein